ncbi:MAG: hypothetical protein JW807_00680 [Spirochaetes bacterium]|nr:hypothetical protein [Spirochaetota bacterium]
MEKSNPMNLTFRDFVRPLFRQKMVIFLSALIIVPSAYISLKFQTPMYQARVLIQIKGVSHVASPTYEGLGGWRIHLTQMAIVKSNPVIKKAVEALGLDKRPLDYESNYCYPLKKQLIKYQVQKEKKHIDSLSPAERKEYLLWKAMNELKGNIETYLEPNTDLFVILVRDFDPVKAVEIANVVSRSYTIYDLQQQLAELTMRYGNLHPTVQQLRDNINKMTAYLTGKELSDIDSIGTASVKIIEQASTNYQPVGKPKFLLMLVSIFVSGLIGMALAFTFDIMNHTFKAPDDMVKYLDIAAIGSIPKKKFMASLIIKDTSASSLYVDFYNDLSDQIMIFMKVQNLKTLLFASVTPQATNIAITANLGFCLSHNSGLKSLVIDANIGRPSVQKLLKLEERPGFTHMLGKPGSGIISSINAIDKKYHILQTGKVSEKTGGLLQEKNIKQLIKKTRNHYDAVLIDCTFVKKISDIAILSSNVDGVVLIVNEGKDHIQVTRSIVHTLKVNQANVIGGILNSRTFPIPGWLYKRI